MLSFRKKNYRRRAVVSQGIIQKGMKYLLKFIPEIAGNLLPIAKLWDAALTGKGELDLSDNKIYTEQQLIWQSQKSFLLLNKITASNLRVFLLIIKIFK